MLDRYPERECVRPAWYSSTKGQYPFTLPKLFKRGASGALWLPESHRKSIEQSGAQDAILYQDSAGTTPVIADGDPIGLFLETSKWGGKTLSEYLAGQPELLVDPLTPSNWVQTNGTLTESGGELTFTCSANANQNARLSFTSVTGRYYLFTCEGFAPSTNTTTDAARIAAVIPTGNVDAVAGEDAWEKIQLIFRAASSGESIFLECASASIWGDTGDLAKFRNLSVKEVEGDHFYQTTDANRRTFRIAANGNYSTEYNGSNHSNVADFSSGAGPSDCSVFVALKTTDTQFVLAIGHATSYYMIAAEDGATSTQLYNLTGSPDIYICDAGAGETTLSAFAGTTRGELRTALADDTWKILELRNADLSAWTAFHMAGYSAPWRFGGATGPVLIVESGPILEASRAKIVTEMIEHLP